MASFGRRRSRRSRRRRSRRSRRSRRRRSRRRRSRVGRPTDLKKYKAERGCTKQTNKKYSTRPGPPYPANLCRGKRKKGNDGRMYESTRAKNKGLAYYKWTKI